MKNQCKSSKRNQTGNTRFWVFLKIADRDNLLVYSYLVGEKRRDAVAAAPLQWKLFIGALNLLSNLSTTCRTLVRLVEP
jgi:hypothetical protein